MMASLTDLNNSINLLTEKIEGLIIDIDALVNRYVTTDELEIASAKIIDIIIKELTEKIESCPCNKDVLDAVKNIKILNTTSTSEDKKGLTKFSPPSLFKEKTSEKEKIIFTMTKP